MRLIPNVWPFRRKEQLSVQTGATPKPEPASPKEGSVLRQQFSTYLRGNVESVIGVFNPQLVDTNRRLQMRNDSDVAFGSSILESAIHNAQWAVESDDPEIKASITAELSRNYRPLAKAGSPAILLGYQVVEKVMEARSMDIEVEDGEGAGKTSKHIPVWWGYKQFKAIDPRTITLHVDPEKDEWDGVQQWYTGLGQTPKLNDAVIGPDRVALWSFRKDKVFGRLTGYPMLDQAYTPWWDKQAISMFANRYFERRADPIPVGRADATTFDENGNKVDGQEKMAGVIGNFKNGGVIVLPNGRDAAGEYLYQLDFLKDDKRGDMYEAYLKYKNEQIQLGLLTPPRVGKASGGSELGSKEPQVQADQMSEFLESIAHDWFDEFVNPQIIRPLGIWNYGQERFERSNTRVVVSGISADVKSLLKEALFKCMDAEASLGSGKRLPIFLQMSAAGAIKTLGIPQPSPEDLKALEAQAAEDAKIAEEQAAAAAMPPTDAEDKGGKGGKFSLVDDGDLETLARLTDEVDARFRAAFSAFRKEQKDEALELASRKSEAPEPTTPAELATAILDGAAKLAEAQKQPPAAAPIVNMGDITVQPAAPAVVQQGDTVINQGDVHLKADLNLRPGEKKTVEITNPDGSKSTATITPEGGAK